MVNKNNSQASKFSQTWRRLISLMLAVCMVISITPAVYAEDISAAAESAQPELPATWDIMQTEPAPEDTAPAEPSSEDNVPSEPIPDDTPAEPIPEDNIPAETEPAPEETDPAVSPQVQFINDMISALPTQVTEDNAEEVRASLEQILSLYGGLDESEQELVDITPCIMLQIQLGEMDSAQTFGGDNEANATAVTASDTEWNGGFYKVTESLTIPNDVRVIGDVTLILTDGCTLTVNGSIIVNEGNSITIDGKGTLNVNATQIGYAGIGGEIYYNGGNITINGGNIIVNTGSGSSSAAIGGGAGRSGGTIIITNGTVKAKSDYGAAIGGGYSGDGGTIIISGGYITAESIKGTGIGNGFNGGSGSFSTGTDGSAWIVASSISDTSCQDLWQGMIFNGNSIVVGGSQTLTESLTVDAEKNLTINVGGSLTVSEGVTLTNNGTITNNGTLATIQGGQIVGSGTIGGNGAIAISGGESGSPVPVTPSVNGWNGGYFAVNENITIPSRITVIGNVTLILNEGFTLTAENGIAVNSGSSLTIEGSGSLNAQITDTAAYSAHAAIGADSGSNAGTVTINSGNITANAIAGSGIGGSGGRVNIYGGFVTGNSETGIGIGGGSVDIRERTNGYQAVFASSIEPYSYRDFEGIIFNGTEGKFASKYYSDLGRFTNLLKFDLEIPAGKTFEVPGLEMFDATITIPEGATLLFTQSDNLVALDSTSKIINQGGTVIIDIWGDRKEITNLTFEGEGEFYIKNLTDDMVPDQIAYTGGTIDSEMVESAVRKAILNSSTEIYGQTFKFSEPIYSGSSMFYVTPTPRSDDELKYDVRCSITAGAIVTKTVTIAKSTTDITVTTQNGDTETDEFTYIDTVTVTAKAVPTGELAQPMSIAAFSLTPPAEKQMALYYGENQLTDPADPDADGIYTMTVDAAKLIELNAPYNTPITLTAKYGGYDLMAEAVQDFTVTLKPAPVKVTSAAIETREYDATTVAAVSSAAFEDAKGNAVETGFTATAEYTDSADVGENKPATVTVESITNPNYVIAEDGSTVDSTGTVKVRKMVNHGNDVAIRFVDPDSAYPEAPTYKWDGLTAVEPKIEVIWKINGVDVIVPENEYKVGYDNNGANGYHHYDYPSLATIYEVTGGNYDFSAAFFVNAEFKIICLHNNVDINGCTDCQMPAKVVVTHGKTILCYFDEVVDMQHAWHYDILPMCKAEPDVPITVNIKNGATLESLYVLLEDDKKVDFIVADGVTIQNQFNSMVDDVGNGELTLTADNDSAFLFKNVGVSGNNKSVPEFIGKFGKLTLNSGKINTVRIDLGADFTMNGGAVDYLTTSMSEYAERPQSIAIHGGTIGEAAIPIGSDVVIDGGAFTSLTYSIPESLPGFTDGSTIGNTQISGGTFNSITVPVGTVGDLLADGYAFYDITTKKQVADTTVSTLSDVYVDEAGKHSLTGDLILSSAESTGILDTDGYSWDHTTETLTLKNCTIEGGVVLPREMNNVAVILEGINSIWGMRLNDQTGTAAASRNLRFSAANGGSLTVLSKIDLSYEDGSNITIDSGTEVTVIDRILYYGSQSAGFYGGLLTVNGTLIVNTDSPDSAIYGGQLHIGSTGRVEVSGFCGINLRGSVDSCLDSFVIEEGGSLKADCTYNNLIIYRNVEIAGSEVDKIIVIPDGCLPDGYKVFSRYVNNEDYNETRIFIASGNLTESEITSGLIHGGPMEIKKQRYTVTVGNGEPVLYDRTEPVYPSVTVTDLETGVTLTPGTDYEFHYEDNNGPGTGKVIVTGKGAYSFTVTKYFEILCGHPGMDFETGKCSICGAQIEIAVMLPDEYVYRFYTADKFMEAWEFVTTAESENQDASFTLFLFKDLIGSGSYNLTVPAGRKIVMVTGGEAWSNASIIVDGELYIESMTESASAGDILVKSGLRDGGGKLILQGASVRSITVEGNGKATLFSGKVAAGITVGGGRIRDILAENALYRQYGGSSGYGWLTEEELNQSSYKYTVEIVLAPVVIYHDESELTRDYIIGEDEPITLFAQFAFPRDERPGLTPDEPTMPEEPAYPAVEIQWYETTGDNTAGVAIQGHTSEMFALDITEPGTYKYYYTVTCEGYTAASPVFTVTAKKWVTVAASSQLGETTETIVPVTGGDRYLTGNTVTVEAPAKDGCKFIGWFEKDAEFPSCKLLTYTFTAEKDVELVAKYEANEKSEVVIEGLTPASFKVSGYDAVQNSFKEPLPIGTKLTITANDPGRVRAWLNGSDKIIGTGDTIEITVTGAMTIKLMYTANVDNQAMVEYVSSYGQLLSYKSYTADAVITEPTAPSKLGYTFAGWSLTVDKIKEKITAGDKHITVTPVYTKNSTSFTVTVKYTNGTNEIKESDTYTGEQGSGLTVNAPEAIGNKNFWHWIGADGKSLSQLPSYFMQLTSDVTLTAVYTDMPIGKPLPKIAITAKYAEVVDGKNKVSFVATRSVPDNYTVVEQGILFGTASSLNDETALILGGANVKKSLAKSTSNNGIYDMNVTVGTKTNVKIYVRGYMILRNNETNNMETIYSGIDSGMFDELYK